MRSSAGTSIGEHRAFLYGSEDERIAVLASFVRAGLDAGDKVVCAENADRLPALLPRLVRRGIDATAAVRSGRFAVLSTEEVFEPATQQSVVSGALAGGYRALRVVTDGTSGAAGLRGGEHRRGEAAMERLTRTLPVSVLCQYARRALLAHALRTIVAMHPDGVQDALLSAEAATTALRIAGEVDRENVDVFAAVLDAASAAAPSENVHLDLAGLSFIDVAGARALVRTAQSLGERALVLNGAPPVLRRVLEIVWGTAANIGFAESP